LILRRSEARRAREFWNEFGSAGQQAPRASTRRAERPRPPLADQEESEVDNALEAGGREGEGDTREYEKSRRKNISCLKRVKPFKAGSPRTKSYRTSRGRVKRVATLPVSFASGAIPKPPTCTRSYPGMSSLTTAEGDKRGLDVISRDVMSWEPVAGDKRSALDAPDTDDDDDQWSQT
jgi:hypothetical protein